MTDQELREMIRESIARHVGAAPARQAVLPPAPGLVHASHGRMPLSPGGDADGMCVIEPAVRCSLCGYCQSLGH
jgi:hypothetical protein